MRPLTLVLAVGLAGCGAFDKDPTLRRFESCDELRDHMGDIALREARHAWSVDFGIPIFGANEYALKDAAGSIAPPSAPGGAAEFSTTNVQEEGVDEADLVKTDGTWIYTLSGDTLVIALAWPIEAAEQLSTVKVDGAPTGMYLFGDTVVVLSSLYWGEGADPRANLKVPRYGPRSVVTVVDVTDRAAPEVVRETYLEGEAWASRRIADRLFLANYVDVEVNTGGWDANLGEAKAKIKASDAEDWMPWTQDAVWNGSDWDTRESTACGCEDTWWSPRETGTYVTSVLSMDLNDPTGSLSGEGVVGRADTLYASADAIYLAWSEVSDGPFRSLDDQIDTIIHKFDTASDKPHPTYVDTVQLTGTITDQFALSEYDDVLRVATTDESSWTTHVWTLASGPEELERLDHLGGLAPGEELYSVRFVGGIGYLVTYEVTREGQSPMDIPFGDPLFTIDLRDPEHIEALGELEMNGWSDYIHPMADDRLLTVGMDGQPGSAWKVAISLFDVSNLREPKLVDREILDAWSSEALWDHHAFNYFAPQEALALPSEAVSREQVLELIHVDRDSVRSLAQITQDSVDARSSAPECHRIRRSVFFEDTVWAVSEGGLTAVDLADPTVERMAVPFEGTDPCWWNHGGYYGYGYY